MEAKVQLRRSELYALVWEQAVQRVAADIGISGVALAKACRKYRIPVPPRGYWRRREFGNKDPRPMLPALPSGADPVISFNRWSPPIPRELTPSPQVEAAPIPEVQVAVPETLDKLHATVRRTRAVLRGQRPDYYGMVGTRARDTFRGELTPGLLDRALRILQGLVTAFLAEGYEVAEGDDHGSGIRVRVQGELLSMSLMERKRRRAHVLTNSEKELRDEVPGYRARRYEFRAAGTLVLKVWASDGFGHPTRFEDEKNRTLESQLGGFVAAFVKVATEARTRREAREEQQRRWAAEEAVRQKQERIHELTRARFRFLEQQSRLWHRQQQVLAFLEAVRAQVADPCCTEQERATAEGWLGWAEDYFHQRRPVDLLFCNPLFSREDSIYHHYSWSGSYGENDEWLETWRG